MHFEKEKTFENSSIHFQIRLDFLAASETSSARSNEISTKNGPLSIDRGSVLQDLMETSAHSARPAHPDAADPSLPFFTNHRNSGQNTLLNNFKKYRLMKELGHIRTANVDAEKEQPRAKKTRSDKTWKSNEKSRGERSQAEFKWPLWKRRKPKLKKRKNWTVTEFGRVEEPRNLLLDIKKKMKLGSACKRDLLRDDTKIRSVVSFCKWEEDGNKKEEETGKGGKEGRSISGEEDGTWEPGTSYFCGTPRKKKKVKKSPPKLEKKSVFKQRVNFKNVNLDFLKVEEKFLTKQLEKHILDLHQKSSDSPFPPQNRMKKSKRPNLDSKSKKRFMCGFHELFSKELSNSSQKSRSKGTFEPPFNLSRDLDAPVTSKKGENSTEIYTNEASNLNAKEFRGNWSLGEKNGFGEAERKCNFLNKSVEGEKNIRAKNKQKVTLFFGKKMSKSKGDKPEQRELENGRDNGKKGNWIKKTTFSKNKIFNEILNPIQVGTEIISDQFENSEQSLRSHFLESAFSSPKKPKKPKISIYNQNTITFCAEDIFGESENIFTESESSAKPENFKNPFENIDLNLGESEDSEWGELLGDPMGKEKESEKGGETKNKAFPTLKNVFVSF